MEWWLHSVKASKSIANVVVILLCSIESDRKAHCIELLQNINEVRFRIDGLAHLCELNEYNFQI